MTAWIVDADVALKWYLDQEDSSAARDLLVNSDTLHAPEFQLIEVCHVLTKHVRLDLIDASAARAASKAHIETLSYWHSTSDLLNTAIDLSLESGHALYDCLYLALATRLEIPIITADRKFVMRFQSGQYSELIVLLRDTH